MSDEIRLTQLASASGCGAKLGPCDLQSILAKLAPAVDPRLLVSQRTLDDAAVVKLRGDLALCFTADIITPVVDDAYLWGYITAANALSDIYAMGGAPLCALNLLCWPKEVPLDLLRQVLTGGQDALSKGGCMLVGGHSVRDKEPKYGLAVIGTIHPEKVVTNTGAKPGDLIYLTKRLGVGVLSTAMKGGLITEEQSKAAAASMMTLNGAAAAAACAANVRAMTDVTGFGLAGHLAEMLGEECRLGAVLQMSLVPLLPGAVEHGRIGLWPEGAHRNREAFAARTKIDSTLDESLSMLCFDPQTSGGLLCAIPPESKDIFEKAAQEHSVDFWLIGVFDDSGQITVQP